MVSGKCEDGGELSGQGLGWMETQEVGEFNVGPVPLGAFPIPAG